jgi:DNA adenine methylase
MRAPLQWYGGKGNMLAKLLPLVPPGGMPYCEPYMGAASLFFARDPAPCEVLNDLDGELVNLFRCLQDPVLFPELSHRLKYTLYSRAEFMRAIEILNSDESSPVLRAWAMFVAANQSVSGIPRPKSAGDWGRNLSSSRITSSWVARLAALEDWHRRLARAMIDNRDALEVIEYWDTPDAVFYVDPPYHPETRSQSGHHYAVEAQHDHHERLVDLLLRCKGAVVLSGYEHEVYRPLEDAGWEILKFRTSAHSAVRSRTSPTRGPGNALKHVARTECVWRNPKAVAMTGGGLFGDLTRASDPHKIGDDGNENASHLLLPTPASLADSLPARLVPFSDDE